MEYTNDTMYSTTYDDTASTSGDEEEYYSDPEHSEEAINFMLDLKIKVLCYL